MRFCARTPYLFKCGVLHRLFCYGFATTFRLINEIGSTLSIFNPNRIRPLQGLRSGKCRTMKRLFFLSVAIVALCGCSSDSDDSALPQLTVKFQENGVDVEKLEFARNESKDITYTISGLVGDAEPIVKADMMSANGIYIPTVTPNGATGRINIKTTNPTANKLIVTVFDGRQTVMAGIDVGYLTTFQNAVVSVETPGTLDAVLSAQYDKNRIAELTIVSGTLNDVDFATLKALPTLWSLNLENADAEALPANAFEGTLLTEVKLPKTLKKIGDRAFYSLSSLKQVDIPSGVTEIGELAFGICRGLTGALVLPQGLTTIGDAAFSYCIGFTGSLVIPQGIATIGTCTFQDCPGFTGDLVISQGVTMIKSYAFYRCSGFTGILSIPKSVNLIEREVFKECKFAEVHCKRETPAWIHADMFSTETLAGSLHVPVGCADAYRAHSVWGKFNEIVEDENL